MTGAGKWPPPGGGQPDSAIIHRSFCNRSANSQGDRNAVVPCLWPREIETAQTLASGTEERTSSYSKATSKHCTGLAPPPVRQSWGGRLSRGKGEGRRPLSKWTLGHHKGILFLKKKLSKCIQNTVHLSWANRAAITMLHLQCSECLSFLPLSGCFWHRSASRSLGHTRHSSWWLPFQSPGCTVSEPSNSLSLKILRPGREPEMECPVFLFPVSPPPGITQLPWKFFGQCTQALWARRVVSLILPSMEAVRQVPQSIAVLQSTVTTGARWPPRLKQLCRTFSSPPSL